MLSHIYTHHCVHGETHRFGSYDLDQDFIEFQDADAV